MHRIIWWFSFHRIKFIVLKLDNFVNIYTIQKIKRKRFALMENYIHMNYCIKWCENPSLQNKELQSKQLIHDKFNFQRICNFPAT